MNYKPGTTFADRYILNRHLGSGGFSQVWLAQDTITDLTIAIKVYAPVMGMDENGLKIFAKELANVYDLNHSNLLKPQHVDTWDSKPYLIMSFCPNGSLKSKIGNVTEQEAWNIIREVGAGLAYLHEKGVIHQDIKPDNILIDEAGHYLITDFGISTKARTTLRKSTLNAGGVSGGTLEYMGPERFGKTPLPVKASDIWSLGALMFELMTGEVPFFEHGGLVQKSGAEIPDITGNYSEELKNLVYSMLAVETWDRPTAQALSTIQPASKQTVAKVTVPQTPHTIQEPQNAKSAQFSPWVTFLQFFYMLSYLIAATGFAVWTIDEIRYYLNYHSSTFSTIVWTIPHFLFMICSIIAIAGHMLMFRKKAGGLKLYTISSFCAALIALGYIYYWYTFSFIWICAFLGPLFVYLAVLFAKYKGLSGYEVLGVANSKTYKYAMWATVAIGFIATVTIIAMHYLL